MSTDPVRRDQPEPAHCNGGGIPPDLHRAMRRRLRRQTRLSGGPTMAIFGHRDKATSALGHAFDRLPELVMGFSLPSRFDAISIYAASVATTRRSGFCETTLGIGVHRNGAELTMLSRPDGSITDSRCAQGWLIDAARRTLALPTSTDGPAPIELPLAIWLDRVMVAMVERRGPIDWACAVALCPVPTGWASPEPARLAATVVSTTPTWAKLRAGAARGEPAMVPVRPHWAAWMDDAMFARWCLGYFPELAELRSDVEFMAPPEVAAGIDHTVRAALAASA